jgi:hypothetical protein
VIRAYICCGNLSLAKPEKAVAVPVRSRHRFGDLGQTAEGLAVPGEAILEDHDPLELAVPFSHQHCAGLQTDAVSLLRRATIEGSGGASVLIGAKRSLN